MKPFESFLAPQLEQYLNYRRSLGFSNTGLRTKLEYLDLYVLEKEAGWDNVTPIFFLQFRQTLSQEAKSVNAILSASRGFFQYLLRLDYVPVNPLVDIPARRQNAFIPFVFSQQQTEQLIGHIRDTIRKTEEHFFNDLSVYLAIVLLARCGLRISEPLRLKIHHYRSEERTIYIEKTKFHKDRLIPVPQEVAVKIDNYLAVRSHFVQNNQNSFLLIGPRRKHLTTARIYPVFKRAVTDIGLWQPRRIIAHTCFGAPTPHSLRHSFAINTLKRCKEQGKSPHQCLPVLAAYMGHRKYRYTALYLKVLEAEQRRNLVDFSIEHQEDI